MKIIAHKEALKSHIQSIKKQGKQIGFVPTMGALHQGHLSLIEQSKQHCDYTVCSIFVNPTQFNDPEDFDKYPRSDAKDIAMLESIACDLLFLPELNEMYPEQDQRQFNFGNLETVMEGAHRPGHFNGVAQIVSKLFDAVHPDKVFFGQKDFQQYVIIKSLVHQLKMPIEIIACPIIREQSGLAMSSRNQRLTEKEKGQAANIYKILLEAKSNYRDYSPQSLKQKMFESLVQIDGLKPEYCEIVDDLELKPLNSWQTDQKIVACVAVFCGKVRLIDNIVFNL
ncbi:MAG: pantoate--beta-alanine ligase [Bacteroidales bacterium]|nr:pantoate--beta-alanine ligase [Bacteroidales bacterium]